MVHTSEVHTCASHSHVYVCREERYDFSFYEKYGLSRSEHLYSDDRPPTWGGALLGREMCCIDAGVKRAKVST